jgi:hypothetical protein
LQGAVSAESGAKISQGQAVTPVIIGVAPAEAHRQEEITPEMITLLSGWRHSGFHVFYGTILEDRGGGHPYRVKAGDGGGDQNVGQRGRVRSGGCSRRRTLDINLTGPYLACTCAIPHMRK